LIYIFCYGLGALAYKELAKIFTATAINSIHSTGANFWPGRTFARVTSAARRKGEQQVGRDRERKIHDEKRQRRGGSRERESEYRRAESEREKKLVIASAGGDHGARTLFWHRSRRKQKSSGENQVKKKFKISHRFTAKEWLSAWLAALFAAHTLRFINNDLLVRWLDSASI
jgi:hypothetical protein